MLAKAEFIPVNNIVWVLDLKVSRNKTKTKKRLSTTVSFMFCHNFSIKGLNGWFFSFSSSSSSSFFFQHPLPPLPLLLLLFLFFFLRFYSFSVSKASLDLEQPLENNATWCIPLLREFIFLWVRIWSVIPWVEMCLWNPVGYYLPHIAWYLLHSLT